MEQRGAGYLLFAWIWLLCMGVINIIQGIVLRGESIDWVYNTRVVFTDLKSWAWIVIIWGVVQCLAAVSIWKGGQYGRWFGIVAASLALIVQFFWLPVYPIWGILMVCAYSAIIYGLAAYGGTHESLSD